MNRILINIKELLEENIITLPLLLLSLFLVRTNYYYYVFLILAFFILIIEGIKKIDLSLKLIIIFSFYYGFASFYAGASSIGYGIYYSLFPPTAYIIGENFASKYVDKQTKILLIIGMIVVFLSFTTFLSIIIDIAIVGLINITRIMDYDFNGILNSTLVGVICSLPLSCIGVIVATAKGKTEINIKITFLAFSIFGILGVIHLVTRTGIIVFGACLVFSFLLNLIQEKKNAIVKIILIAIICFVTIYVLNLAGTITQVISIYDQRTIGSSWESAGSRTERWLYSINQMVESPFGWVNKSSYFGPSYYGHNLWLDTARISGIIPFAILSFISIIGIVKTIQFVYIQNINSLLKYLWFSMNVSFILSSFVEPIIEGCFMYFLIYIMFLGMQNRLVTILQHRKLSQLN